MATTEPAAVAPAVAEAIAQPTQDKVPDKQAKGAADGTGAANGAGDASATTSSAPRTSTDASSPTMKTEGSAPSNGAPPSPLPAPGAPPKAGFMTMRSLVSTKEAGIIIGKGGHNVSDLREKTGVKAGVSKVIPGNHDRIVSITGTVEQVASAFAFVADTINENPPASSPTSVVTPGAATIRLLVPHSLMGTVIGRQGARIKHIQETSGVRMVAEKEMLPASTERIVELLGTPQAIQMAVHEIAQCLHDDWDRSRGTMYYQPQFDTSGAGVLAMAGEGGLLPQGARRSLGFAGSAAASVAAMTTGMYAPSFVPTAGMSMAAQVPRRAPVFTPANLSSTVNDAVAVGPGGALTVTAQDPSTAIPAQVVDGDIRVQNISIPSSMVGCIIGKGGSKITEIRRQSGSRISIAKNPHDESGERMFTIHGTSKSNETALFLLYQSLEGEKTRRAAAAAAAMTANGSADEASAIAPQPAAAGLVAAAEGEVTQ